jgi:hypothetical protein
MKNANYGILIVATVLLTLLHFFHTNTSLDESKQMTSQSQQTSTYSQIRPNQNDSLAGSYQTSNSISGFKNLILDSTYTYAYSVQGTSGEAITLEGSWELSYKGQAPHIILHRPLPNEASLDLKLANIEEHRLKVTADGLRDLYTQENYLQVETDEYSLAVFNKE